MNLTNSDQYTGSPKIYSHLDCRFLIFVLIHGNFIHIYPQIIHNKMAFACFTGGIYSFLWVGKCSDWFLLFPNIADNVLSSATLFS